MDAETLEVMQEQIRDVIGKIDRMQQGLNQHNAAHEKDMQRMMPIIEDYEQKKRDAEVAERVMRKAEKSGKIIMAIAGFIIALGTAYLTIKSILS